MHCMEDIVRHLALLALAAPLALTATTSHAAKVDVEVLHPSEIELPDHVRSVIVVDRSRAANAGQALLGALESAVTNEGLRSDRDAARDAVLLMTGVLQASPGLEVVHHDIKRKHLDASLWDKALSPDAARDLCVAPCDAIVSLESFDTDSFADGVRVTGAVASWRVYDGQTGQILDAERMNLDGVTASSFDFAFDAVLNDNLTDSIGQTAALAYAARITPTWQLEQRRLLGTARGLRAGIRDAKAGHWDGAVAHWTHMAETGNRRQRGKALFNLAVASEAQGDLDQAIALVSDAHATLNRRASRNLSVRLRTRVADDARLQSQLAMR